MHDLANPEPTGPFGAMTKALMDAPLNVAPSALRPAIWRVWQVHQHLFPSPLPIAAAVGVWVRDHGLSEADAQAILTAMLSPEMMGNFRYASDLMTTLAVGAGHRIRHAAAAKYREEQRQKEETDKADALSGEEIKDILAGKSRGG